MRRREEDKEKEATPRTSSSPEVSGISNLSFRVMNKPIGERHKPIDHVT